MSSITVSCLFRCTGSLFTVAAFYLTIEINPGPSTCCVKWSAVFVAALLARSRSRPSISPYCSELYLFRILHPHPWATKLAVQKDVGLDQFSSGTIFQF